jgi:glycosyltransferase involved in cell wall biosynthesis
MPCFNAESYVVQAVESALGQTYRDIELIVVDDGSTDGTARILGRYRRDLTLIHQSRGGAFVARNRGLSAATGEFVAFLDSDDYWDAACLEKLHAALLQHGADVAYCGWQNLRTGTGGNEPYVPPDYNAGDVVAHFLGSCPWPIHAALTRRRVIDALGGFSERRRSAMDYDLWLRLLGVTRNIVQVPEVLAFYRWHDKGQISSVRWRQVLDAREARRAFAANHPGLVRCLQSSRLRTLLNEPVRTAARECLWRRDLVSARILFRAALGFGALRPSDAKYAMASLLPSRAFSMIVGLMDKLHPGSSA